MTGPQPTTDVVDEALSQVDALLHGLATDSKTGLTCRELRLATGLSDEAVLELTSRLMRYGLVDSDGTRFWLGIRLFELGGSAPLPRTLREAAVPFVGDLYEATHETIHVGVLMGSDVLYIEKLRGHDPAHVATTVGARMPASCTALGKAMLAFSTPDVVAAVVADGLQQRTPSSIVDPDHFAEELRRIAATGVAYDREENEVGVTCIAAPVLDRDVRPVGALSITGPVERFDPALAVDACRTAARGLSSALFSM